jgi:hypothetical protein
LQNDEGRGQRLHNQYLHQYEGREPDGFQAEGPDSNRGPEVHSGSRVDDVHRQTPIESGHENQHDIISQRLGLSLVEKPSQ